MASILGVLKRSFRRDRQEEPPKVEKIAIVVTATNKYIQHFPHLYETCEALFLTRVEKTYFLLTDQIDFEYLQGKSNIVPIHVEHTRWPFSTMLRFRYIDRISEMLEGYSHLLAVDVDVSFCSPTSDLEFFSHNKPLFGVQHPGFVRKRGSFEMQPHSLACVDEKNDLSVYWAGGFWGGQTKEALELARELARRVDEDWSRGVIAVWHDESHLNKYFIENKSKVHTFDPGYMYPESRWLPFKKRILALDKNHAEMRAD